MDKLDLIFYKNTFINREIAFILDIKYDYIDDIKEYNYKKKLFVSDIKMLPDLEKNNLKKKDYLVMEDLYDYFDEIQGEALNDSRDLEEINNIPIYNLSLTQMLIKVLYSKPRNINCRILEEEANIDMYGNVWGCCPTWTGKTFGNILSDDVYNNYIGRMLKLSSINKTFCFCFLNMCKNYDKPFLTNFDDNIDLKFIKIPKQLTLSIDRTCNLRCKSCRTEYYKQSLFESIKSFEIIEKMKEMGWLNNSCLLIAGQGEAFFSPIYLKILEDDSITGDTIKIMSNGVLFTEDKWQLLEKKYKNIYVAISIDAASKDVYAKLRRGNFDVLLKNLEMLGKKRKQEKIVSYQFNFVVQKENMNDMLSFIELAKRFNVDIVKFTKLNDWGTTSLEEYKENSLLTSDDCLTLELYDLFKNPLFKEKIVDISDFDTYLENSRKKYEIKA